MEFDLPSASNKESLRNRLRHIAYAGGSTKFEPFWCVAINTGQVLHLLPLLETILTGFGEQRPELAFSFSTPTHARHSPFDWKKLRMSGGR